MPRRPPTTGPYVQDDDSEKDEHLLSNFVPSDDYEQEVVQAPASPQNTSWCEDCEGPWWIVDAACASFSRAFKTAVTSLNRVIILRPTACAIVVLLFGLIAVASRQLHSNGFFIPDSASKTPAPTVQPVTQPIRHPAAWWKEQLEAHKNPAPAPLRPISKLSPQPQPLPTLSPTPPIPAQPHDDNLSSRGSHQAQEGEAAWLSLTPLQQQEVLQQVQRNRPNGANNAAPSTDYSSASNLFNHLACSNWSTTLTSAIRPTPCNLASPRNVILVYEKDGSHGTSLLDLSKALNETLKYASRLCARILYPPPFMVLNSHQNRRPLNCSWQWSRYWDWDKLSPVVSNWKDVLPLALGAKDESNAAYCSGSDVDYRSLASAKRSDLETLRHLALNSGRMSAPSIPAMFQLFLEGKPFVHTMDTQALVPRSTPCNLSKLDHFNYVPGFPSNSAAVKHARVVERMADGILSDVEEKTVLLLSIHHADATNASDSCDSYLTRLHAYLNCTIGGYNGTFPLILFMTDEIDPVYRDDMLRILQDFSLRALNIEPLAMARLQEQRYDNFGDSIILYAIMDALKSAIDERGKGMKSYSATFGGKNFPAISNDSPLADCEQRAKCDHSKPFIDVTDHTVENATAGNSTTRRRRRRRYTRLRRR